MRIRIFQRGKISGSRTVDHQIFSTYTFTKCQIFVLRKNSGESISYPFAFGIEGLSNSIYRRLFSFTKSHKGPEKVCVEKISSRRRGILCVEKIRSRPRGILCVDKIGSVPPDRRSLRRQLFFPADFGGPADCPALPHIGTLARLIIKYPACQLLGKKFEIAAVQNVCKSCRA